MNDFLLNLTRFAMLAFLLAGMLELGLGLTLKEVLDPLRNARLVALSLVANFVVAPLLAIGIAKVLRLDEPFAVGLLLLGLAPGAPFIPKVVQLARGNLAFAAGLMVMLMVGTVMCLPLLLPWALEGVQVDAWKIARPLVLFMLVPLIAGMVLKALCRDLPAWLRSSLGVLSNLSGLLVVVLIVALNFKSVLSVFGTGAILAVLLFVGLSLVTGWLFGSGGRGVRDALALGTGSRNVAAALVVAAQNFQDPKVNVMVIVSAVVGLGLLLPTAGAMGKRVGAGANVPPPTATEGKHDINVKLV